MNIQRFIREQKEKALDRDMEKRKTRLLQQNEHLERERIRQANLSKVAAQTQALSRDTKNIKAFNDRAEAGLPKKEESALMRIGKGLAKVVNRNKVSAKPNQKGFSRMAQANQGSRGINFGGFSGGISVGGSGSSPFNQSVKKKGGGFKFGL